MYLVLVKQESRGAYKNNEISETKREIVKIVVTLPFCSEVYNY